MSGSKTSTIRYRDLVIVVVINCHQSLLWGINGGTRRCPLLMHLNRNTSCSGDGSLMSISTSTFTSSQSIAGCGSDSTKGASESRVMSCESTLHTNAVHPLRCSRGSPLDPFGCVGWFLLYAHVDRWNSHLRRSMGNLKAPH